MNKRRIFTVKFKRKEGVDHPIDEVKYKIKAESFELALAKGWQDLLRMNEHAKEIYEQKEQE